MDGGKEGRTDLNQYIPLLCSAGIINRSLNDLKNERFKRHNWKKTKNACNPVPMNKATNEQMYSKNTGTRQDLNLERLDKRPAP